MWIRIYRCAGTNPVYTYAWTARGSTPDTGRLSATNIEVPTFSVPNTIEISEFHHYTLTVSAENADDVSVPVSVEVRNAVSVVCKGPYEVDEGDADIELECDASSGPPGSTYTWSWIPSINLTDHNTGTPTFAVPASVDRYDLYVHGNVSDDQYKQCVARHCRSYGDGPRQGFDGPFDHLQ